MGKFLLATLMMLQVPYASADDANVMEKRILQGDWNIGGAGALSYNSFQGLNGYGGVSAQYFIWDKISLGLQTSITWNKRATAMAVGPKATYYFYETNTNAYYLSQNISFSWNEADQSPTLQTTEYEIISAQTSLGFAHFITPNVSIGPELRYLYYLDDDGYSDLDNDFGLLVNFNLFF